MTDIDVVARIKEAADIVQVIGESVALKKSGANYQGLCPFHGEKTPSFSVNPVKQFYHCFGCGVSGDVIEFVMKYQSVDFPEALRILGGKYGIPIPERQQSRKMRQEMERRKTLFAVSTRAAKLFEQYLHGGRGAAAAHAYLQKRGVDHALARRFSLGYAPAPAAEGWNFLGSQLAGDEISAAVEVGLLVEKEKGGSYDRFRDRIVFPVFSVAGEICGFGGRIVGEGQPKYLNSPESAIYNKSSLLLGLYQAKQKIRAVDRAIVVEGNFDMISLAAAGCDNVVAPLGTALTREQLRQVKKFTSNVTLLFDGDAAGEKAAIRAVPLFLMEQMAGRVAILPKEHDPDSYVREYGLPRLLQLLEEAQELPEFSVERLVAQYGLSFDGKMKIVDELKDLLAAAGTSLQRSVFIAHFAERLDLPAEELRELLKDIPVAAGFGAEPPPPIEPVFQPHLPRKKEEGSGLNRVQRKTLEFMILHPEHLPALCDAGLQEFLTDSFGQGIVAAQNELYQKNPFAEPEDLLTCLQEEEQRNFVTKLLLAPPEICRGEERDEVLAILKEAQLSSPRQCLERQIKEAEQAGDRELVKKLLAELLVVNGQILQERERVKAWAEKKGAADS